MKIFKSKHYPRVMYFLIALVFILIFFSMLSIEDGITNNLEKKSVTGFAVNENSSGSLDKINDSNSLVQPNEEGQVYSAKSYMIFYISLIALVTAIFLVFISLRSSVLKSIEKEDREKGF